MQRTTLRRRRAAVALLTGLTVAGVVTWMVRILGTGGLDAVEALMLVLFAIPAPIVALSFWNGVLGVIALRRQGDFLPRPPTSDALPEGRTAMVVPVCDEDPAQVFRHVQAMLDALDGAAPGLDLEVFVLSDSRRPEIVAGEEARFAAWRGRDRRPARLHYRRRADNHGFKAGNIWDFCSRHGHAFDYMLVLDADSLMSAEAMLRLIRAMEADPRLGILQPLIVGLPSESPFARIFQFGMRLGMRTYGAGAAWWQGDESGFWGHNAIVRLAPFLAHCRLPELPGGPPLGGPILSHDQVEAVLIRRGGYDVRVLPIEAGSFEQNPPTLADFLKRDLRWCQGNMQYTRLLALPGIRLVGRIQLLLAIMMYLASPAWLGFVGLGLFQAVRGDLAVDSTDLGIVIGLFGVMVTMSLAPKLFGLAEALLRPALRRAYGGGGRLLAGFGLEFLVSLLLAPAMALAHSIFIGGLLLGRTVRWERQQRAGRMIGWGEAWRGLWPHTLIGAIATVAIAWRAPAILPFAAPILSGLLFAVPFARWSSSPALGRRLARIGLCATPEEASPPPVIARVVQPMPAPLLAPLPAGGLIGREQAARPPLSAG